MDRLVILCCLLSSITGISSGTLCLSNTACPDDQTLCVQNCSAVAVEEFNLTASHGNCMISSTIGGSSSDTIYGCHIDTCDTEACVASSAEVASGITCCCNEDFCNTNLTVSPTEPTYYHIYPSFPSHVTADQLVCEYYNCTNGTDCVRGYEVCDENPLFSYDDDAFAFVCIAFNTVPRQNTTSEKEVINKSCFIDEYDPYNETCVMKQYSENIYGCLCNSTLCNNNGTPIIPSNHTFTSPPTVATEPTVVPTINGVTGNVYPTYPDHTKPGQLVCQYYNCTDEDHCMRGYEVCDESPLFDDDDSFVCIAVLHQNASRMDVFKSCFIDDSDQCNKDCVLKKDIGDWYTCCCNSILCNTNVGFTVTSDYTSTTMSPTASASDDKTNYMPLVYGTAAGVCLLVVSMLTVIMILVYCRYRTTVRTQMVSYNKLINS